MQLSPSRKPDESLSDFRFRYARFSFKWAALLAIAFWALLAARSGLAGSSVPILWLTLFFGLPIGVGMGLLAGFGFLIGGVVQRQVETNATARRLWLWARLCMVMLFAIFFTGCSAYWAFRGIATSETLAISRYPVHTVTLQGAPSSFWLAEFLWTACMFSLPYLAYRRAKQLLNRPYPGNN